MTGRPDRFVFSDVDRQGIVDALQEGVAVLDSDGRIFACNQAAAAIRSAQLVGELGRVGA
jgi:PAS domain-containing protein